MKIKFYQNLSISDPKIIKAKLINSTFETKIDNSYWCLTKEELQLDDENDKKNPVTLTFSSIQFEAFSKTSDSMFSNTVTFCANTEQKANTIIIIIISSILVLVAILIVIAVWCVCCLGRTICGFCGSRREAYSPMP
jgi:hypothetical protein